MMMRLLNTREKKKGWPSTPSEREGNIWDVIKPFRYAHDAQLLPGYRSVDCRHRNAATCRILSMDALSGERQEDLCCIPSSEDLLQSASKVVSFHQEGTGGDVHGRIEGTDGFWNGRAEI
jgi:hypothetical protein